MEEHEAYRRLELFLYDQDISFSDKASAELWAEALSIVFNRAFRVTYRRGVQYDKRRWIVR